MKNKNRVRKNRLKRRKKRDKKRRNRFGKEGANAYWCRVKKREILEQMDSYRLRRNGSWKLY